jgi:pyrimidine operon attenuation protein / uracil phosphoribosyltransferase
MEKKYILSSSAVAMKLRRIAYEILENNRGENHIILAGIHDSGSVVASQLQSILTEISPISTQLVTIRFDKKHPSGIDISNQTDFTDKVIIIIDDVTNSGKTLLYALKPFLEYYPRKIQTLVLVERSHKTYPIHPDYVGLSLSTTLQEHIFVEVKNNEISGAYLA